MEAAWWRKVWGGKEEEGGMAVWGGRSCWKRCEGVEYWRCLVAGWPNAERDSQPSLVEPQADALRIERLVRDHWGGADS